MKIEECKVGMRVFEKTYEHVEGEWWIPTVGRQGIVKQVYAASARVRFDNGEEALFTQTHNQSKSVPTHPWARLRHISAIPHIEQARRLSMQKIAIVRRIKLLHVTVAEARNVDWEALAKAVGELEFALAGLMQGARG